MHYDVWIDQKLIPATDWWVSICEAIADCDVFIIVLTPKSVESLYCTEELRYAVALNKPIIPILLKNCAYPSILGRRQYEDATAGTAIEELLLNISQTLMRVSTDLYQGKYITPPDVEVPDEPIASDSGSLYEMLSQASEALEAENYPLAEQFCQRVIQADPLIMGEVARELLADIQKIRLRKAAYDGVRRLLDGSPALARTAPTAWRKFVEVYGAEPDPDGLAERVKAVQPPPPRKPDLMREALTRARNFIHEGKKNTDWTPFVALLSDLKSGDLKIPDMPFCLVPTGTFQMGSNDYGVEQPIHPQTFNQPFYIAQYPVTNGQWRIAVNTGAVGEPETETSLKWYNDPKMVNVPVVGVNWFDCQKFAAWLGCRLPTEREWEYAARGVDNLVYPWGDDFVANNVVYDENSGSKPWEVNSKPEGRSWVGAHHLSGNIWEWQASLYGDYPYVADGSRERDANNASRVLRGGSWFLELKFARAAFRFDSHPYPRNLSFGFRLVFSPPLLEYD